MNLTLWCQILERLELKDTDILAFPKFTLCQFAFTKELNKYLFSQSEKNQKRILAFIKKKKKKEEAESKNSIQHLFCRSHYEDSVTPDRTVRVALPSSLPRSYTQQLSTQPP